MMWWPDKCSYVKCDDLADECDTSIKDGHLTHAMMTLAIEGKVSEEAHYRCFGYTYIEFIETVQKMLRLTRLLSFT